MLQKLADRKKVCLTMSSRSFIRVVMHIVSELQNGAYSYTSLTVSGTATDHGLRLVPLYGHAGKVAAWSAKKSVHRESRDGFKIYKEKREMLGIARIHIMNDWAPNMCKRQQTLKQRPFSLPRRRFFSRDSELILSKTQLMQNSLFIDKSLMAIYAVCQIVVFGALYYDRITKRRITHCFVHFVGYLYRSSTFGRVVLYRDRYLGITNCTHFSSGFVYGEVYHWRGWVIWRE